MKLGNGNSKYGANRSEMQMGISELIAVLCSEPLTCEISLTLKSLMSELCCRPTLQIEKWRPALVKQFVPNPTANNWQQHQDLNSGYLP